MPSHNIFSLCKISHQRQKPRTEGTLNISRTDVDGYFPCRCCRYHFSGDGVVLISESYGYTLIPHCYFMSPARPFPEKRKLKTWWIVPIGTVLIPFNVTSCASLKKGRIYYFRLIEMKGEDSHTKKRVRRQIMLIWLAHCVCSGIRVVGQLVLIYNWNITAKWWHSDCLAAWLPGPGPGNYTVEN